MTDKLKLNRRKFLASAAAGTAAAMQITLPASVLAQAGYPCLLYTSPSPRDGLLSRMPSSA